MKYKYRNLKENDRLYDNCDLTSGEMVKAQYWNAGVVNDTYSGNPLVESIPMYMSQMQLSKSNANFIKSPSSSSLNLNALPPELRLSTINSLDKLIVPMRWHYELQREIYWCLVRAYENRRVTYNPSGTPVTLMVNEADLGVSSRTKLPLSEGIAGFSVLGLSGCGKSKAVELALSHIPQAIIHFSGTPKVFIQIPYLYIVCQPNSNMAAIWNGIAEAVDQAVGNDMSFYYYGQMKKLKRLDEKLDFAVKLCKFFNVGIIIIDEIEFIKTTTRKDTLESLLSFNNRSGCALAVVGTSTDKNKLFPTWQMCRRFGRDIDAAEYCENFEEYKGIFDRISEFRWFDNKVVFTDEMKQIFYNESKGTIGSTITIYKELNKAYVEMKEKGMNPEINPEFILKCAKSCSAKSFERVQSDNNPFNINEPYEHRIAALISNNSEKSIDNMVDKSEKNNDDNITSKDIAKRITEITAMLKNNFDFSDDFINSKVSAAILGNPENSNDKIRADVMEELMKTKKPAKAKSKKKPYYDIENAYKEIMKHAEV